MGVDEFLEVTAVLTGGEQGITQASKLNGAALIAHLQLAEFCTQTRDKIVVSDSNRRRRRRRRGREFGPQRRDLCLGRRGLGCRPTVREGSDGVGIFEVGGVVGAEFCSDRGGDRCGLFVVVLLHQFSLVFGVIAGFLQGGRQQLGTGALAVGVVAGFGQGRCEQLGARSFTFGVIADFLQRRRQQLGARAQRVSDCPRFVERAFEYSDARSFVRASGLTAGDVVVGGTDGGFGSDLRGGDGGFDGSVNAVFDVGAGGAFEAFALVGEGASVFGFDVLRRPLQRAHLSLSVIGAETFGVGVGGELCRRLCEFTTFVVVLGAYSGELGADRVGGGARFVQGRLQQIAARALERQPRDGFFEFGGEQVAAVARAIAVLLKVGEGGAHGRVGRCQAVRFGLSGSTVFDGASERLTQLVLFGLEGRNGGDDGNAGGVDVGVLAQGGVETFLQLVSANAHGIEGVVGGGASSEGGVACRRQRSDRFEVDLPLLVRTLLGVVKSALQRLVFGFEGFFLLGLVGVLLDGVVEGALEFADANGCRSAGGAGFLEGFAMGGDDDSAFVAVVGALLLACGESSGELGGDVGGAGFGGSQRLLQGRERVVMMLGLLGKRIAALGARGFEVSAQLDRARDHVGQFAAQRGDGAVVIVDDERERLVGVRLGGGEGGARSDDAGLVQGVEPSDRVDVCGAVGVGVLPKGRFGGAGVGELGAHELEFVPQRALLIVALSLRRQRSGLGNGQHFGQTRDLAGGAVDVEAGSSELRFELRFVCRARLQLSGQFGVRRAADGIGGDVFLPQGLERAGVGGAGVVERSAQIGDRAVLLAGSLPGAFGGELGFVVDLLQLRRRDLQPLLELLASLVGLERLLLQDRVRSHQFIVGSLQCRQRHRRR